MSKCKHVESYLFWLIQISSEDKSSCALRDASQMENLKTSSHFKEQFVLICAPDTSKRLVCLTTESCYSYILKEQRVPSLDYKIWPIFQREANNDLYCSLEHVLDPEEKRGYDAMRYFYNSSPKIILQKDKVYISSRNA